MRWLAWVGAATVLLSCGPGRVEHQPELLFGDVAIGQARRVALVLKSSTEQPVTFELTGDFAVDASSITLRAGETIILVSFAPTALGPRTGTLLIHGAAATSEVSLVGRGTGPHLSAPARVTLPDFALVPGEAPIPSVGTIVLGNAGTLGALLELSLPRTDDPGLCVGSFVDSVCQPWQPAPSVDTQALLEVPVSFLATTPGPHLRRVFFATNDPLEPEVTVEVLTFAKAYEPCVFSAPTLVMLRGEYTAVPIKHLGPGTCLIREVTVRFLGSVAEGPLELDPPSPPRSPLASGETLVVTVKMDRSAWLGLWGTLTVAAAGTAPLNIHLQRELSGVECLTVSPSALDFGIVPQGCASPVRHFQIYNSCAVPVVLDSMEMAAGSSEFRLVQSLPPATVVQPGSPTPASFSVQYQPLNFGPATGAVVIAVQGEQLLVGLQARGDAHGRNTDRYRQATRFVSELLVMVDPSPSFVPKRAGVRANLVPLLSVFGNGCYDMRVGFAAADGAPDAGVQLITNDAGQRWSSSLDPNFAEQALSALEAVPVGSELEACVGPAADLMEDAGVRDGGRFWGYCITDALEQSPSPTAALARLQSLAPTSWIAVAGVGSACTVEAIDDGVHLSLANASFGFREDICDPFWGQRYSTGCDYRRSFYLNSSPSGALELTINGAPVADSAWVYESANNRVTFAAGQEPPSGALLEISYTTACP